MKRVLLIATLTGVLFLTIAVLFSGCKKSDTKTTTIKGTAYFPAGVSGDLSNAKVSIYTSLDNWNFNQPIKFVSAVGAGATVTFTMENVLAGNYYLDVWKDIDNTANWTSGDFVGWYGSGGLGSPALTEFQITDGQTLSFDVQMYIIAKGAKLPK
jgi:multisubunit Na+/H+ antiporter MnhB subunit